MSTLDDTEQKGFLQRCWESSVVQIPLVTFGVIGLALFGIFVTNFVLKFVNGRHILFKNWYIFSDYAGLIVDKANQNLTPSVLKPLDNAVRSASDVVRNFVE